MFLAKDPNFLDKVEGLHWKMGLYAGLPRDVPKYPLMVDLNVPTVPIYRVEKVVARSKARNEVWKLKRKISKMTGTASAGALAKEREKLVELRKAAGTVKSLQQLSAIRVLRKQNAMMTSVATQYESEPAPPGEEMETNEESAVPRHANQGVKSVEMSELVTEESAPTTESLFADINDIVGNRVPSVNLSGFDELNKISTDVFM